MRLRTLSSLPRRATRGVRARLRAAREHRATRPYRAQSAELAAASPTEYRAYLDAQLRRTLPRRENDPGVGQRILVEAAAKASRGEGRVLCVGCRNGLELDAFRAAGLTDVRGIDIFSQRDDILVMDMHAMTFADDAFDVVYASHSLEHALELDVVARELVRVGRDGAVLAVEVPIRHRGSDADLVVFSGIEMLEGLFAHATGEVLLREEHPARSARNEQGSEIARLVVRLAKQPTP